MEARATGEGQGALMRAVRRLWGTRWLMVIIVVIIIIALVGHMVVVYNAANSIEVESVGVTDTFSGSIAGTSPSSSRSPSSIPTAVR